MLAGTFPIKKPVLMMARTCVKSSRAPLWRQRACRQSPAVPCFPQKFKRSGGPSMWYGPEEQKQKRQKEMRRKRGQVSSGRLAFPQVPRGKSPSGGLPRRHFQGYRISRLSNGPSGFKSSAEIGCILLDIRGSRPEWANRSQVFWLVLNGSSLAGAVNLIPLCVLVINNLFFLTFGEIVGNFMKWKGVGKGTEVRVFYVC